MKKTVLFFLLFFANLGIAQTLPTPISGGFSFSAYDSRFFQKRQEDVWLRGEFCLKEYILIYQGSNCSKNKIFLEKRGETPLLSYAYEDQRMYFSYGNRFRPLQHFFFLRETFDFSSFWFLEQPTVRTGFLGFKFGPSTFGSYYAEGSTEKKPGFFFKPFRDYMELAYSPDTKEGFLLLEFPSATEKKLERKHYGFRMETFGTKENPQGLFSASWQNPDKFQRVFVSGYKGRSGQLFNLSETVDSEERASLFRFLWEPGLYNRLQYAQSERNSPSGTNIYTAKSILARVSLFQFPYFAFVVQARTYRFSEAQEWVWGKGLYLAYQKKFWRWEIGQEWRNNGDRITEAGLQISIGNEWRIYSSLVYSEERNHLPVFAEESITPEETGLVVTDKTFYSFIRIFHPYFAIHLRHSREKDGRGDGLSLRFQVFLPIWE